MNVASVAFLAFGLVVALIYNIARPILWRQAVLLVANISFLATFAQTPTAWLPYASFLVLGYVSYVLVRKRVSGAFIPLLAATLIAFFWLKRYSFLPSATFLPFPYVTLGLSYVLFRILHLLIDTRDGVIVERIGPVTFLSFTLNFTAIISGPIQRFQDYAATQLVTQRPRLDVVDVGILLERVVIGYFKISILGALFQSVHSRDLSALNAVADAGLLDRSLSSAIITVAYPLYLYCNFSGYTDIVIGVARGFRLVLPENFDRPFAAMNFLDFWGRWHMSLSSWLKTYVYNPLLKALMQRFPNPKWIPYWGVLSFFFTFFLIGLWHGQTSEFVVYGVLLGLGVSLNKLYQILMTRRLGKKSYRQLCERSWYQAISRGITFSYFAFSLVWFWSNWAQMAQMSSAFGASAIALGWLMMIAVATVALSAYEALRVVARSIHVAGQQLVSSRYLRVVSATALVVVMTAVLKLLSVPAPEIVYKAF
jgi:alginate O-acetyltransferase complex protein AlgI